MAPPLPQVYLNGQMVAPADAKVSVLDRGFLFGDGVYEVIPVYGGHALRLSEHVARLRRSLEVTEIVDVPVDSWSRLVKRMIGANGGGDMSVYIEVTRGVGPDRDHRYPDGTPPTVLVMCQPAPGRIADLDTRGVDAIVSDDLRWARCDIKATSLLANVMARQAASNVGAVETIMVKNGIVTEGAASSVFLYADGALVTPPNTPQILPGITRDFVLELARDAGLNIRIEHFPSEALRDADEIMLSSSVRELVPVCRLDGAPVGDGRPGPVWRELDARYQAAKQALRASAA